MADLCGRLAYRLPMVWGGRRLGIVTGGGIALAYQSP